MKRLCVYAFSTAVFVLVSGTSYPDGTVSYQATYYSKTPPQPGGTYLLVKCQVVEDRHFPFAATETATGTRTTTDAAGRVERAASGQGGATDYELLVIKENPQWWDRIVWTKDGKPVDNPFK